MNLTRPLLLSALLLSSCAGPGDGDGSEPHTSTFSHTLGSARAQDSGAKCSIGLTAPAGSPLKSQRLTFVRDQSDGVSWRTQEFPVSTGSSKSLAELQSQLGTALRRGLTAPAGASLTKIGDIAHGGEVALTARGGGEVAFLYNPPVTGGNPVLTPGETAAFAQLLGK